MSIITPNTLLASNGNFDDNPKLDSLKKNIYAGLYFRFINQETFERYENCTNGLWGAVDSDISKKDICTDETIHSITDYHKDTCFVITHETHYYPLLFTWVKYDYIDSQRYSFSYTTLPLARYSYNSNLGRENGYTFFYYPSLIVIILNRIFIVSI